MRKFLVVLALVGLAATAASAQSMPVSTFLAKADALQAQGPLAVASPDFSTLRLEVKAAAKSLREEQQAAVAAGRKPAFCQVEKGSIDSDELLAAMRAVPPAQRSTTEVKSVLKALKIKKYPCPA
jgi:hypothetical protein